MPQDYMSVDEAAEELEVSRATMWKWIKDRSIPTFRILGDRRTLVKRADLETLKQPIPKAAA